MRLRLFEFEDLDWLPGCIRDGGTDYLRYLLTALRFYDGIVPALGQGLREGRADAIVDLCAGGGGSITGMRAQLSSLAGTPLTVTLTDRFPNLPAWRWLHDRGGDHIRFDSRPIDAAGVPGDLTGFRTLFTAAHHFTPERLRDVLRDAVARQSGIAVFDANKAGRAQRLGIPLIVLVHPIVFALWTPFFRPFRWSRLVFTYLVPLIPVYTIWDGCVSVLRLYDPEELLDIARSTGSPGYHWRAGTVPHPLGVKIAYLIGTPGQPAPDAVSRHG